MRPRLVACWAVLAAATFTISWLHGQDGPPSAEKSPGPSGTPPATPAPLVLGVENTSRDSGTLAPSRDLSRLNKIQQQHLLTAQRGADWLYRMNGVKGRFLPGYLPALKQPMESDNYFHQVSAAAALARAARFTGEERFAVRATQALLALLEDTVLDASDSLSRHTIMPPAAVNRIASASLLVLAIHELPSPQKDLLDRAEELLRYVARQPAADGKTRLVETVDRGLSQEYSGMALSALAVSNRRRPAAWKMDLVRRALPGHRTAWEQSRSMDTTVWLTVAFAEAFLQTKEKELADLVLTMNDWLCTLQYTQIDPRRMYWYGGFMTLVDGRSVESEPVIQSGHYACSLIEAGRVARERGDIERHQRFQEGVERCLQFLGTLQYTEAGTQHFSSWYRPQLVGAFHLSRTDGNIRLDYTQHAVCALFGYLEQLTP